MSAPLTASRSATPHRQRSTAWPVRQLNAEFAELSAQPHARQVVRQWADECSVLRDCTTLVEIDDYLGSGIAGTQTNQALAYLLNRGQTGEHLALRTVYQRMLAVAVRMSCHARPDHGYDSRHEGLQIALGELWSLVVDYPLHRRPDRISGNVAMELLHRLKRSARPRRDAKEREIPSDQHDRHAAPPQSPEHNEHLEVLHVLAWGLEHDIIDSDEVRLLTRIYTPAPDENSPAAIAEELGLSHAALRKRCSRAVRALGDAAIVHNLPAPSIPR